MAIYSITNPFSVILSQRGSGLNDGDVYFGVAGQDPETNPITVYWDAGGAVPALQPIPTIGGYFIRNGSPAELFAPASYSVRARDRSGAQVFYLAETHTLAADLISTAPGKGADLVANAVSAARAEDYGALADATNDDAAALQAALDTGRPVYLRPDKTYAFGTQLTVPTGGGFFGWGTLKMLTGAGKFDAATYSGAFSSNVTGIYALSVDNIVLECKVEMQANAGIRVCHPVAVRGCQNIRLDVEAFGFKEMQFGAVAVDSSTGFVRDYVHDITPDSTSLPWMQISGLSIDADRIGGVNSNLTFDVRVVNVLPGVNARATYGAQSDACNIQSQGYAGIVGTVFGDTVGEVLDLFGDGCTINVVGKDCYAYGVKLIHGATGNTITASINTTCGSAVVLGGSSTSNKEVRGNTVICSAYQVGEIGEAALTVTTNGTTTIDVTAHSGRQLAVNMRVRGVGIPAGSIIASLGTGTGGTGTYVLNQAATTTASGVAMKASRLTSAAASTDGSSATYKPKDNKVTIHALGNNIDMDALAEEVIENADNEFIISGKGWARHAALTVSANNTSTFDRAKKSNARARLGATTTIANGTTIIFDTQNYDTNGEYDPATGIFTANKPMWLDVNVKLRAPGIASGADISLGLYRNVAGSNTLVARNTDVNESAGSLEIYPGLNAEIYLNAGETASVAPITAIVGSITVDTGTDVSWIEFKERS